MTTIGYNFSLLFEQLERMIREEKPVRATIKTVTMGNIILTVERDVSGFAVPQYVLSITFKDTGRGQVVGRSADKYEIDAMWTGVVSALDIVKAEERRVAASLVPAETVLAHFTHGTDKYTLIERGRNREKRVEVQSKSGEDYTIMRDDRGALSCTCKGFIFRRSCRHSLTVLACTQPGGVFEKFTNYKAS